jgi:hypothetical protein
MMPKTPPRHAYVLMVVETARRLFAGLEGLDERFVVDRRNHGQRDILSRGAACPENAGLLDGQDLAGYLDGPGPAEEQVCGDAVGECAAAGSVVRGAERDP